MPSDDIGSRLRKVEGQIRGIQRMVSQDAQALEVLTQLSAASSALERVGAKVLEKHLDDRIGAALADPATSKAAIDDILRAIDRFRS